LFQRRRRIGLLLKPMPLFYVAMDANDSIKESNPTWNPPGGFKGKRFLLAVEAENEHDARALIQGAFARLGATKDFGEVMTAKETERVPGWFLELPEKWLG
jgi:hypothetical protein